MIQRYPGKTTLSLFTVLLLLTSVYYISGTETALLDGYTENQENVILVTVESTRADHLPCYGYHRDTAPNICGLEQDGVKYTQAYSTSSWTLPSLTSMQTSRYPRDLDTFSVSYRNSTLEDQETMAEFLRDEGYTTIGVGNAPFFHSLYGLDKGFDRFNYNELNSREQVDLVLQKLDEEEEPFYLWLHIFDPHQPYTPPEETEDVFSENRSSNISADRTGREFAQLYLDENDLDHIKNRYDEEIRFTDNSFGLLMEGLKDRDLYDSSLIIATSDHGEDFKDRDRNLVGHGRHLYNVNIHVPLIVKFPQNTGAGEVVETPVGLTDILPTVKDLHGADTSRDEGESLLQTWKKGERGKVVSQLRNSTAVIDDDLKLLTGTVRIYLDRDGADQRNLTEFRELYNLSEDPYEKNSIEKENSLWNN